MKKIAVIQDLSGLGKCSLTAAIPVISVMGVQAVPLLTAVLSNQTGYPSYYCDDYTEHMGQIMDEWEKRGFSPDGIYTGFLADEEQADKILDFLRRFRKEKTMVLVDPVMGDNGSAYGIYTEGLRERMVQCPALQLQPHSSSPTAPAPQPHPHSSGRTGCPSRSGTALLAQQAPQLFHIDGLCQYSAESCPRRL